MVLPSKESLLSHVLEQLDADPSGLITGCAEFGKDAVRDLLCLQVLAEIKAADAVLCLRACDMGCDMAVVPRDGAYYIACPRGQTKPAPISKDEVRQFRIDVTHFAGALCAANGIECAFDGKPVYGDGIFHLGRKDIGGGPVEFVLAMGLTGDEFAYTSMLNLRTHIRAGAIIALSPTFGFSDARHLNHLHAEKIYPMAITVLLEYPDRLVMDSNRMLEAVAPRPGVESPVTLLIEADKMAARYKNIPLTLQPTPFKLFLHLARHAGEVVERDTIYDMFWPQPSDGKSKKEMVYVRQIDDHIRHIRDAFREALKELPDASSDEKAERILETKKKAGFRLNIPCSEIRIA